MGVKRSGAQGLDFTRGSFVFMRKACVSWLVYTDGTKSLIYKVEINSLIPLWYNEEARQIRNHTGCILMCYVHTIASFIVSNPLSTVQKWNQQK